MMLIVCLHDMSGESDYANENVIDLDELGLTFEQQVNFFDNIAALAEKSAK